MAKEQQDKRGSNRDRRRGRSLPTSSTPTTAWPAGLLAGLTIVVAGIVLLTHEDVLTAKALYFDDQQYLVQNYLVQNPSWASAGRFLGEVRAPSTVDGYYQPLAMISLMLDCAMGGRPDDLVPFHRTSLALHVANTVLIVVLLYLLIGSPWAAAMAGLLFGVHPMTVEPISWISERKTMLATFLALWSLVSYVRYARTGRRGWYGLALATLVLALMSKPTTTPLPLLMLLLDYWPLRRLSRRAVIEKIPFLVIAVAFAVITYISQKATAGTYNPNELSPMRAPLIVCHNIVFYPSKMFWPVNLSSYYPFPKPMDLSRPMVLAGVIGTGLLVPLLLVSLRWTRVLVAGWLFFFLAILPTMGIIGFTLVIASDRYAYLPAVGLLLVVAALLGWLWSGPMYSTRRTVRRLATLAAVLILCGLETGAARRYQLNWRDSETLLQYMLKLNPDSAALHNHLAYTLNLEGKDNEAIEQFADAIRLDPAFPDPHYSLGTLLANQQRLDEAIAHYTEALRLKPTYAEAHNNLGIALAMQGKSDEAIGRYTEALRLKPTYAEAHNNLALELVDRGNLDEAIGHYDQALRFNPAYAGAHANLAYALVRQGRLDKAARHFRIAIQINPGMAAAHKGLGAVLERQGHSSAAIREYQEALRLNPRDSGLRDRLDKTLVR